MSKLYHHYVCKKSRKHWCFFTLISQGSYDISQALNNTDSPLFTSMCQILLSQDVKNIQFSFRRYPEKLFYKKKLNQSVYKGHRDVRFLMSSLVKQKVKLMAFHIMAIMTVTSYDRMIFNQQKRRSFSIKLYFLCVDVLINFMILFLIESCCSSYGPI